MIHLGSVAAGALIAALALAHRASPSRAAGPGAVSSAPTAHMLAATVPTGEIMAGSWWICESGANLEVDGPRVRCRTPPQTIDVVPSCGVGHALVPNLSGNRDRCRNVMGGLLDYTCPVPHFSPVITTGQDICRRVTNGRVGPPSIMISY